MLLIKSLKLKVQFTDTQIYFLKSPGFTPHYHRSFNPSISSSLSSPSTSDGLSSKSRRVPGENVSLRSDVNIITKI